MTLNPHMFMPHYYHIIAHLSKPAQDRIMAYVNEIAQQNLTPSELYEHYQVQNLTELVQHLAEYESGTPYVLEDPLIQDYNQFSTSYHKQEVKP
jgi:hypothetical protein